ALLNSALVRWFHYVRFRDARQPILPQLKISHLRALPEPPNWHAARDRLAALGAGLSARPGPLGAEQRRELDEVVSELYALTAAERALVNDWHARLGPTARGRGERAVQPASKS
ncbi:MAG TPA: hypothetical protein VG963_32105, partial [Polyangiaceae bacterium]|nr:hypothetical protein [Polyangiaceae bacterium]